MKIRAALIAAALGTTLLAAAPTPPDGFEYVPSSQTIQMGIGCTGTGVCDSTEYWIGLNAGTSTVGSLPGQTTPVNEVTYQVEGAAAYIDEFPADDSIFGKEFVLRTDEALEGQVTISGYQNAGFSPNLTIDIDLLVKIDGGFGLLEATATTTHLPGGPVVLEYSIPLDEDDDGKTIVFDSLELTVRGANVLTGFINGQGGSYFDVPTYELVPTA